MDRDKKLQKIHEELKEQYAQLAAGLEEANPRTSGGIAYNPDRNDLANEYRSRERRTSLRALETQTLQQIEQALTQIEEGTYGECVQCHQPINVERLEILPYATLCVSCQSKANSAK
ncbi:MAG TPA: TraR/DksA C4-type zinc finger protein [Caldilineaceae bacterium]|nr:TraR/DksA C4-type zinc finger protein [Caldilineaceae bacterium]